MFPWMLQEHPDLILTDSNGDFVNDPDWPEEFILDIRAEWQRQELSEIVGDWIRQCGQDGFDAIEIDNLDTFTRFSQIVKDDAIRYY